MAWFKRKEKGITTATEDKKDVPKGLWYKSPTGKIIDQDELARNLVRKTIIMYVLVVKNISKFYSTIMNLKNWMPN